MTARPDLSMRCYAALFFLLDFIYDMTKSDDIGTLLGDMNLQLDGGSNDADMLERWQSYGEITDIDEGYQRAIQFLRTEDELINSVHLREFLSWMEGGLDSSDCLLRVAWRKLVAKGYQIETGPPTGHSRKGSPD